MEWRVSKKKKDFYTDLICRAASHEHLLTGTHGMFMFLSAGEHQAGGLLAEHLAMPIKRNQTYFL